MYELRKPVLPKIDYNVMYLNEITYTFILSSGDTVTTKYDLGKLLNDQFTFTSVINLN